MYNEIIHNEDGSTQWKSGQDTSIMSEMEQIARLALYIRYNGQCPECGSPLNQTTAECTNKARHDAVLMEAA